MKDHDYVLDAIENMATAFVVARADGNIEYCNKRFSDIVEWDVGELEGLGGEQFMDAANYAAYLEQFARRQLGGNDPYDVRLSSATGARTRVRVFPTALFSDGTFVGSCVFAVPFLDAPVTAARIGMPEILAQHATSLLRREEHADQVRSSLAKSRLSPREKEIFERIAPGNTAGRIARDMGLNVSTVTSHLRSIYAKFGVRSRVELLGLVGRVSR